MLSFHIKFVQTDRQMDGRTDKQKDWQTDNRKTVSPDLLIRGHKNELFYIFNCRITILSPKSCIILATMNLELSPSFAHVPLLIVNIIIFWVSSIYIFSNGRDMTKCHSFCTITTTTTTKPPQMLEQYLRFSPKTAKLRNLENKTTNILNNGWCILKPCFPAFYLNNSVFDSNYLLGQFF